MFVGWWKRFYGRNFFYVSGNGENHRTYVALKDVIKDPYGSVNSGAGYGYFSDCTHPARQGRSSIYNTTGNELKIYTCLKLNDPLIVTTLKIY